MTEYELVMKCENALGWTAPRNMELWKARRNEVAKLKRAMAKKQVTMEDLQFALELVRREQTTIKSPVALVYRVEEARDKAVDTRPVENIAAQIQDAIDFEMDQQMPGWERWISRLSRCQAQARADVFAEWAASRLAEAA